MLPCIKAIGTALGLVAMWAIMVQLDVGPTSAHADANSTSVMAISQHLSAGVAVR
jgi:hypothetical protein